ncbi:MAG TPA: hypothetical protein PLC64_15350, partial [Steroidobacteraceae bacterium]|nr:hypothetical protein [Steroidobacteraceae bacterium]
YCDADDFAIGGLTGVTVAGNVVTPATSALPAAGYRVGQTVALDLLDVAARNVYPRAGSRLVDAGDATYATSIDFNGNARSGSPDAGAYQYSAAQNPGWVVAPGFKNAVSQPAVPGLTFSGNPLTVSAGGSTQLEWNATNASTCTASASPAASAWSGARAVSGNQTIDAVAATTQFNLSCSNAAGTTNQSVIVTVSTTPAPVPTVTLSASPTTVSAGQRSTLTWSSTNATGCTASGAWAGNKASAGSEQSAVLNATSTFTLACTGAGGTSEQSVTVNVSAGGGPPTSPSGGGGGGLGWPLLAVLIGLHARRMRT